MKLCTYRRLGVMVHGLPMLPREDGTGDDVPDREHGRQIADDLTHTPIWNNLTIVINTLDSQEPHVRRENDGRLYVTDSQL